MSQIPSGVISIGTVRDTFEVSWGHVGGAQKRERMHAERWVNYGAQCGCLLRGVNGCFGTGKRPSDPNWRWIQTWGYGLSSQVGIAVPRIESCWLSATESTFLFGSEELGHNYNICWPRSTWTPFTEHPPTILIGVHTKEQHRTKRPKRSRCAFANPPNCKLPNR